MINVFSKLARVAEVTEGTYDGSSVSYMANKSVFRIPVEAGSIGEEEIEKTKADIAYQKGFLQSVDKKLANEKFVNNAPAQVIDGEKKKKADAEEKIQLLEQQLAALN